ncbi:MAG: galactose-1-phosphate uridylyltransferase [Deltaproteobacteria bacterium]|nr:galactose-1-phosphate uridylyltransferase [Deltaproteobacteria bacterium]
MSELRRDPLMRRWVIVAPERRADVVRRRAPAVPLMEETPCPFCPGNEAMNPNELYAVRGERTEANPTGWLVRITPDRRPLLHIEGKLERRGIGPFDLMSAIGAHELVVDTPDHHAHWADFDLAQMTRLLESYLTRFNDLRRDPRFRQIALVKNHGAPTSRYPHNHSHIVATPFVPRRIDDELAAADFFHRLKERCVFCDCLEAEVNAGSRVISANLDFVAFAPYASCFPFEIWILPRQHHADFGAISQRQLPALAALLRDTMSKLRTTLANPHFSLALHSGPLDGSKHETFHWHWELIPHLAGELGMEWATGVYFNPVAPEDAAAALRDGVLPDQSEAAR